MNPPVTIAFEIFMNILTQHFLKMNVIPKRLWLHRECVELTSAYQG